MRRNVNASQTVGRVSTVLRSLANAMPKYVEVVTLSSWLSWSFLRVFVRKRLKSVPLNMPLFVVATHVRDLPVHP